MRYTKISLISTCVKTTVFDIWTTKVTNSRNNNKTKDLSLFNLDNFLSRSFSCRGRTGRTRKEQAEPAALGSSSSTGRKNHSAAIVRNKWHGKCGRQFFNMEWKLKLCFLSLSPNILILPKPTNVKDQLL